MARDTPMKIRGKRGTNQYVKDTPNKRLKGPQDYTSTPILVRRIDMDLKSRPKHKIYAADLSFLEQLPTEILQHIFELSGNIDLALTSPHLAQQLNCTNLHRKLANRVLRPVIGYGRAGNTDMDISTARRLMDAKFFTYGFFITWTKYYLAENSKPTCAAQLSNKKGLLAIPSSSWEELQPDSRLMPPKKLFLRPFTSEKTMFLQALTRTNTRTLQPEDMDLAREGLQQAVEDGMVRVLPSFWRLGLWPDVDLLLTALHRSKVDVMSVITIIRRAKECGEGHFDFLDPRLWACANQKRAAGKEIGSWLLSQLACAASVRDTVIFRGKGYPDDLELENDPRYTKDWVPKDWPK